MSFVPLFPLLGCGNISSLYVNTSLANIYGIFWRSFATSLTTVSSGNSKTISLSLRWLTKLDLIPISIPKISETESMLNKNLVNGAPSCCSAFRNKQTDSCLVSDNPLYQRDTFHVEVPMVYHSIIIHPHIPYYLGHENSCQNEFDFDW